MKKVFLPLCSIIFLLQLASCSMFQVEKVEEIKVTVKKVSIETLDQRRVRLKVSVVIHNPNSYEVTLSRAESDIFINGTFLAKAISPQSMVINGRTEDEIDIDINYRDVIKVIENYNPDEKINCQAKSTLYFQLPSHFEKRKVYTRKMVLEKQLPALNEMIQKEFDISF